MADIVTILRNLVDISFPAHSDDPEIRAQLKKAHDDASIPALRLLQDIEAGIQRSPAERETELLTANNDYLRRARNAEAENRELKAAAKSVPHFTPWDLYAGHALQGISSHLVGATRNAGQPASEADANFAANHADALLALRNKRGL